MNVKTNNKFAQFRLICRVLIMFYFKHNYSISFLDIFLGWTLIDSF